MSVRKCDPSCRYFPKSYEISGPHKEDDTWQHYVCTKYGRIICSYNKKKDFTRIFGDWCSHAGSIDF